MTEAWHFFPYPGLIKQGDGSTYQWANCAPATWANLLVSQQQGVKPAKGSPWWPSGASLRTATGDRSGGIIPSLLDYTVNRVYGVDLEVRITTVEAVEAALDRGYAVGLLVRYKPISDAGLSGSPGFTGNHSIALFGSQTRPDGFTYWLDADPLYDGRRAGIPVGPKWVRRSILIAAGEQLVLDSTGQTMRSRYGPGRLYAVFTTEPYTKPPAVVTSAPATAADKENKMIRAAWRVSSGKVQRLQPRQPLFDHPGGPIVTRIASSTPRSVSYLGAVGNDWGAVLVQTAVPYSDHVLRPTVLYVPSAAGPVSNR